MRALGVRTGPGLAGALSSTRIESRFWGLHLPEDSGGLPVWGSPGESLTLEDGLPVLDGLQAPDLISAPPPPAPPLRGDAAPLPALDILALLRCCPGSGAASAVRPSLEAGLKLWHPPIGFDRTSLPLTQCPITVWFERLDFLIQ